MSAKTSVALLVLLVGAISAEVVQLNGCSVEDSSPQWCTVHEVRIDPCKAPPGSSTCTIKKRKSATLSFDFTPTFAADKLKSMAYLDNKARPGFPGMDSDACKNAPCPLIKGARQTYSYDIKIGKLVPTGTFSVVWKLWNEEDEKQSCCFKQTIVIRS